MASFDLLAEQSFLDGSTDSPDSASSLWCGTGYFALKERHRSCMLRRSKSARKSANKFAQSSWKLVHTIQVITASE